MATLISAFAFLVGQSARAETVAHSNDRHVVLVVWDGMRPDFITERDTPRLAALARVGVRFTQHHSVYPTSTEVNGAALATGVYPTRSGLLANREYRPDIKADRPIDTGEWENIRRGDELTHGKYLAVPTIAETVRRAGLSTAIAGSKAVVFLHDRNADWSTAVTPKTALTIFAATPKFDVQKDLGRYLDRPDDSNEARNRYTTRALIDVLWRDSLPAFSLLWLSQPDLAQHATAPGSEEARLAIKNADECLGSVIDAIATKQQSDNTDIMVVSDHGFSTIERTVDLPAQLNAAGFSATGQFNSPPKTGDIMVVGNGGTALFYVIGHDREVTARLVDWLERNDYAGVLFTREKFEGAFPLEIAHLDTASAPDIVMSFRWNDGKNSAGIAGRIVADSAGRSVGHGSHASLSPFDLHNVFIAAGPDFPRGLTSETPTSNIDIAPTIYRILNLPPPTFDGRVVDEAMTSSPSPPERNSWSDTKSATRAFGEGKWRQTLRLQGVENAVYLDEGNGGFTPK